jgi:hypothetical protein
MPLPGVPERLIRKIIFKVGVPRSMGDVRAFRELLFRELQLDGRLQEAERIRRAQLTEISVAIAELV